MDVFFMLEMKPDFFLGGWGGVGGMATNLGLDAKGLQVVK